MHLQENSISANKVIKSSLISRTRSDATENIETETNEPKENLKEQNSELRGRLKIAEEAFNETAVLQKDIKTLLNEKTKGA